VATDVAADTCPALCATISETTPSEKLVYNRGRGKDSTCLVANQLPELEVVPRTKRRQYEQSHCPCCRRAEVSERHRLGDGDAHSISLRMLTP
jgi:hypothetical protein